MKTTSLPQLIQKLTVALWLIAVGHVPAQTTTEAWVRRYNGSANYFDAAVALAVDSSGNVVVTGYSYEPGPSYTGATIKYSSAGAPLWTNNVGLSGNAVTLDSQGNVLVAGKATNGVAVVAYSGAGLPFWTNLFDGGSYGPALALDGNGNVVVTATTSSGGRDRSVTFKCSNAGVPLWTNVYVGVWSNAVSVAVATDTDGNVVVTGFSYNGDSNDDYLTIKYSAAGVRLWTNIYNGTGNWVDHANAIAVDSNGNVFVTGESWNGIRYDYLTIVYSSSGVPLWTRRYNDEQGNAGSGNAIKVDATGNVIVTGDGCVTIKYSGAGVALWTNRVGLASGLALAVDGSGNVFVTGTVSDPPFGVDYLTVAYSATGMPLWTNIYDGPANGDDRPAAVAVDSSGNVFVTGYSYGVGTSEDWATIKYSIPPLQPIPLNYQAIGSQLVLSWTNAAFSLQTAPAAQGTYTNIHGATSPWTNGFSNAQGYFRLKAN